MTWSVTNRLFLLATCLHLAQSSPGFMDFLEPLAVDSTVSNCSKTTFEVDLHFNKEFHGLVYAKHYPQDCFVFGNQSTHIRFSLNTTLCGVRLEPINDTALAYTVNLVVQTDRYLQQRSNFDVAVLCVIPNYSDSSDSGSSRKNFRAGRKSSSSSGKDMKKWMEMSNSITGEGFVAVGGSVTVSVKAHLPRFLSMRVVNCTSHDGAFERVEYLTDHEGCPIDYSLFPAFHNVKKALLDSERENKYVLMFSNTAFPAFKFPDSAFLHLKCTIEICHLQCPKVQCDSPEKTNKTASYPYEILETEHVYNSIEVAAPGLDTGSRPMPLSADRRKNIVAAEKKVCLSTPKIALAFTILGGIFLLAVMTTFCSLMRSRRRRAEVDNYSRFGSGEPDNKWLCT